MQTLEIPSSRLYTAQHAWLARPVEPIGETPLRVGVTPEAVDGLDIVAVDLPPVRSYVQAGSPCAVLWTGAWNAITVLAPISGLVTLANATAVTDPDITVADPFEAGWLFAVLPSPADTMAELLTAAQYQLARCDAA